ncbi:threonine--tRNA ligase [Myxococcus llanfairpwllgwyngyllgogerychwyrndrobwllllantysiliogogogochensis]|uniref:Threonine--tRNA ligase n=1 Tax=Myxococcus llanfairpwllgwyngyllgogerychwyrndrobwllllantysiliogogogochensis TaxID=2590453 RepID=A0A540WM23_9BACT|nr:threonine--tRNA ligase [Myxococcus llanfairpwllgwyngyllgogerychwyrndrobwllllantysiliogogogochensis]TQF09897.1 threonine--tRNA ligase [Myxococcus llanfairpwllgwyngyllgogerychwyrndrobwllllantysiliogogogochensis]
MLDEQDHRSLGHRLDLFHLQEEAPGMVFWHPRGWKLYQLLEERVRQRMKREGYLEVRTPQVYAQPLWERSGHWENFRENMFLLQDGDRHLALKPVSCPGHIELVQRMAPSYRDLPLRLCEFGLVHRSEPGGALHGLFRLRQFTQDDGHIFCAPEQVVDEVVAFARSLKEFYASFGFDEVQVAFSGRPASRAGSDEVWDQAEEWLAAAAKQAGLDCKLQPGQGAFYGPKLEFVLKDRLGREWQCGTIQLDLVLPERFDLRYQESSGAKVRPVMLHRALLGSLERFIGVLLEHHGGALPAWLAPEQVVVAPVGEAAVDYAERFAASLRRAGCRARVDARGESLSRKVLDSHQAGVPWLVVVGGREVQANGVRLRKRDGSQRDVSWDAGLAELAAECGPAAEA